MIILFVYTRIKYKAQPTIILSTPLSRLMSMFAELFLHEPAVKSGISIELERCRTDHSLRGTIELQLAAS